MFNNLRQWFHDKKEVAREWMISEAKSKHAIITLGAISFAESSFFPVPPDFFLVPMIVAHKKAWLKFTTVVFVTSVLGALLGYLIGLGFFDLIAEPLIDFYDLHDEVAHVGELFEKNAFLAIFLSAFTPIPFKVFTISAGLFKIKILPFLVATILGRGLRFFVEGAITRYFGHAVAKVVYRYFDIATIIVIIGVVLFFVLR